MLNHKWKGKVWWFESLRIIWCLEISKYTQHLMLHQTKLTAVCPHCQNLSYWDLLGEMKIIQNLPTNKRALTACYCQQCSNEIHGGINNFFFFFWLVVCYLWRFISLLVHFCALCNVTEPSTPRGTENGAAGTQFHHLSHFLPQLSKCSCWQRFCHCFVLTELHAWTLVYKLFQRFPTLTNVILISSLISS